MQKSKVIIMNFMLKNQNFHVMYVKKNSFLQNVFKCHTIFSKFQKRHLLYKWIHLILSTEMCSHSKFLPKTQIQQRNVFYILFQICTTREKST